MLRNEIVKTGGTGRRIKETVRERIKGMSSSKRTDRAKGIYRKRDRERKIYESRARVRGGRERAGGLGEKSKVEGGKERTAGWKGERR